MAYVLQVHEWTSTGTKTDKTDGAVRFKNANNSNVDTGSPMTIPPSNFDYSFEKYLRFKVTAITTGTVNNLRVYSDGANGMGSGIAVSAKASTAFAAPIQVTSSTGFTDLFTFVSTGVLQLSTGTFSAVGYAGDFGVFILSASTAATAGVTGNETVTFAYDETT